MYGIPTGSLCRHKIIRKELNIHISGLPGDRFFVVMKKEGGKEKMNLNEAIEHCWESVKKEKCNGNGGCASEHEQLARWLETLRDLMAGKVDMDR